MDRLQIATQTSDLPATVIRDLPISTDPRTFKAALRIVITTVITTKALADQTVTIKITTTGLHRKEALQAFKDQEMGSTRWVPTTTIMATTIREVEVEMEE